LGKIRRIQALVQNGLYYLTEHAFGEALEDQFDIFDIEHAILGGRMRRTWPRERKYEIVGPATDGRLIGLVCRVALTRKVRIITVYEDRPKQ
jgi:hypothetical protein